MNKKRIIALIMALAMLTFVFCGCAKKEPAPVTAPVSAPDLSEQTPPSEEPTPDLTEESAAEPSDAYVTVTDMLGREVSLDKPASRIVALTAADCEIIYALGAGDLLVGRGAYCDYPPEVLELPSVESGYETNIEQIIDLEPQVLFMSTMAQSEDQINQLENAGVRVVMNNAQDIDGVYSSINMIGALLGKQTEADALISDMKAKFNLIKSEAEGEGKTVYFEVSPLQYGLWTAGTGTFMNEIAEMLGLENVFADVSGWGEVSEEQVIDRDPDYIVTISMYFGEGPTPVEEIMSRPGWENVAAVKNGAILNLQNDELSRPSPRLVDGASMLCDFINEY